MINKDYVEKLVTDQLRAFGLKGLHPLEALQLISDLEKDLTILLDKFIHSNKEIKGDEKELFDSAAAYIFTKSYILNQAVEHDNKHINTPPTYTGAIQ